MNNTFGIVGTIDMNSEIAMDMAKSVPSVYGKPVHWIKKVLGFASIAKLEVSIRFNNNNEWYYDEYQRSVAGKTIRGQIVSLEIESMDHMRCSSPVYWFAEVDNPILTHFIYDQVEWIVLAK
jgi:hypothetical protein